jgi:hypothetical protein
MGSDIAPSGISQDGSSAAMGQAEGRAEVKVRHVNLAVNEWISGMVVLDNAERGLLLTACLLMWSSGGAIRLEHLRAACRDHGLAFKRQLAKLIELGELRENEAGTFENKQALNELRMTGERIEKRRRISPAPKDTKGLQAVQYTNIQSTSIQEAKASCADAPPAEPIQDLWNRGVALLGSKGRPLLGRMVKQYGDVAVLAAIVETEREPRVDAAAYFIACCGGKGEANRQGAIDTLREGAARAAAAIILRERASRDSGTSLALAGPLLGWQGECRDETEPD